MSFSIRKPTNFVLSPGSPSYWSQNGINIYNNSSIISANTTVNRGTLTTANNAIFPNGYTLDVSGSIRTNYIYDGTDFPGNYGQILSNIGQISPQLGWTYQGSNFRGSDFFPENEVFAVFDSGNSSTYRNGAGVLGPNGVLYFSPNNNNNFGVKSAVFTWNPYTNQRSWAQVGIESDKQNFSGGCITAPNGSMYFLPYGNVGNDEGFDSDASAVLVINPYKKTGNLYTLIDNTTALTPCLPNSINADYEMRDLSSEGGLGWRGLAYRYILQSGASRTTTNNPAAGNNFLYAIPYNSSKILKINWYTNTTNLTDVSLSNINRATYPAIGNNASCDISKWYGGVLAPNGSIYCIPNNAQCVMKINPSADGTSDTITFPAGLQNIRVGGSYPEVTRDFNKWRGGALAPNGKIYCAPYDSSCCLVINPSTDTVGFDISGIGGSFTGAILAPNGKIYCAPTNGNRVLVLNPETNSFEYLTLAQTIRSFGPILTPQGYVAISVWTASGADYMPVIKTGLPRYPLWMLSPEFNKV